MSATAVNGQHGKVQPSLPSHVENKALGIARQSTPDSDAVVSSDDDHDQNPAMSMSLQSVKSLPAHKAVRRSSWLSEVQTAQRKYSLGGLTLAPGSSQPGTPSGENGWDSTNTARSFPWNAQVWQKDRPTRLNELVPSPTNSTGDDLRSPMSAVHGKPPSLPFDIPLEPSRKTVRSQSYSAGQLEKPPGAKRGPIVRRGSRQMLGLDGSLDNDLGSLKEDDDGESSSNASGPPVQLSPWNSPTANVQEPHLAPAGSSSGGANASGAATLLGGSALHTSPSPFEATFNQEQAYDAQQWLRGSRPLSQAPLSMGQTPPWGRSQWQSSLGFGIPEEGSQSRRHSFAVETVSRTRNPSSDSDNATPTHLDQANFGTPFESQVVAMRSPPSQPAQHTQPLQDDESNYFSGMQARQAAEGLDDPNPFLVPNVFSRPVRILHVVAFKSNRADIFYIQDNTGLTVQPGDMVIVEGDRGQDLGTVQHSNVSMDEAKRHKQTFTTKHFQTLMMFSRHFPNVASVAPGDIVFSEGTVTNVASAGGPTGGKSSGTVSEPRPRMIKRIARANELHMLRDKEGNEAKAKRVGQGKVNEHGLRMEILDAEFQHDYKKLTFFFYAEEYINFNELVTDLFKTFKTRIWMSAINPASFPHPGVKQNPAQQRAAQRAQEEFRLAVEQSGQFDSIPDGNDSIQAASRAMAANMMSVVPRGGQTVGGPHLRPNQAGANRLDPTATGFGLPPVDSYTNPRLGQTGYQHMQENRNPGTFGNFVPSPSGNTGPSFNHHLPTVFPNPWAPQGYGSSMGYNNFGNATLVGISGSAASPMVSQMGQAPSTQIPQNSQIRATHAGYAQRSPGQHPESEVPPAHPSGAYGYVRQYPDIGTTPLNPSGPSYTYARQFAPTQPGAHSFRARPGANRGGLRTHGQGQFGGARLSSEGLQTEFEQLSLNNQPQN